MRKLIILSILLTLAFWNLSCQSQNNESNTSFSESNSFEDISPKEASKLIAENTDVIILDVRTAQEVNEGYIENSKNIDISSNDFESEIQNLDKSKKYVLYCRSGRRSARASKIMLNQGFNEIYNIEGGILAWQQTGLPIIK